MKKFLTIIATASLFSLNGQAMEEVKSEDAPEQCTSSSSELSERNYNDTEPSLLNPRETPNCSEKSEENALPLAPTVKPFTGPLAEWFSPVFSSWEEVDAFRREAYFGEDSFERGDDSFSSLEDNEKEPDHGW